MAHKKSGGAKARQGSKTAGKRLGFKYYSGEEVVKPGSIIIRQRGTKFHSGAGTGIGRDHTIFAKAAGIIDIKVRSGKSVIEIENKSSKK